MKARLTEGRSFRQVPTWQKAMKLAKPFSKSLIFHSKDKDENKEMRQFFQEAAEGTDLGFVFIEYNGECTTGKFKDIPSPGLAIVTPKDKKVQTWWRSGSKPTHEQLFQWMKDSTDPPIPEFSKEA